MKKVFALMCLALTGSVVMFTSCNKKKDWKCECVSNMGTGVYNYNNTTRDEAEDGCADHEATARNNGVNGTCTLSER